MRGIGINDIKRYHDVVYHPSSSRTASSAYCPRWIRRHIAHMAQQRWQISLRCVAAGQAMQTGCRRAPATFQSQALKDTVGVKLAEQHSTVPRTIAFKLSSGATIQYNIHAKNCLVQEETRQRRQYRQNTGVHKQHPSTATSPRTVNETTHTP